VRRFILLGSVQGREWRVQFVKGTLQMPSDDAFDPRLQTQVYGPSTANESNPSCCLGIAHSGPRDRRQHRSPPLVYLPPCRRKTKNRGRS
jgi:hypothetical protein